MTWGFKDHFSENSQNYKAFRPTYPPELFEYLAGLCPDHQMAWDAATGNGQAAMALESHFDQIIATDGSAEQIAQAEKYPRVQYKIESAENCSLPDASVDLITVAQAMHWFDFNAFNGQVKRIAKPGGIIAIWSYSLVQFENEKLNNLVRYFYEHVVHKHWPPERAHVDAKYQTIPFPFNESFDIPQFKIKLGHTRQSLLNYLSTWSGVKNYIKTEGVSPLDSLNGELLQFGSHEYEGFFPMILRIGSVH